MLEKVTASIGAFLSGSAIVYTVYLGYTLFVFGRAVSYYPWAWMRVYAFSGALDTMLATASIAGIIFAASIVALVKPRSPAVTQKETSTLSTEPEALSETVISSEPAQVRDLNSVDELIAELGRSKERLAIIDRASKQEERHILAVERALSARMQSHGYPITDDAESRKEPTITKQEVKDQTTSPPEVPKKVKKPSKKSSFEWDDEKSAVSQEAEPEELP
ncbi:MAG: hypothetical protein JRN67_11945, partial [Nitrososphaerota archaeon]|nr:hypothetical protein [Nitrososphaerota archaeon]